MFDSDNIPLSTRVEAKNGVIVTYNTNSNGEGIWTASIDSEYIAGIVNDAALSDSDRNDLLILRTDYNTRMGEIEALLGVTYVPSSLTVAPEDSDIFRSIKYVQTNSNLLGELKIKWKIVSFDGDTMVSKNLTFAVGSTTSNIMNALLYSIKTDTLGRNFVNNIRFDDFPAQQIHWTWKTGYDNLKIAIDVIQSSETVSFVINQ